MSGLFDETSSTAEVNGNTLKHWLYKLPSYMTFDDLVAELCEYLENRYEFEGGSSKKGWPIYWDLVKEEKPNPNLADGVKTMMKRLNRNVSVRIVPGPDVRSPPDGMFINYYDSTTDTYSTLYFPCWG
jgi:hypothetical protein